MPDQYDKTNTVTVWPKRADAHDRAPDYRVDVNFEGRDLEIALWKRDPDGNPNAPVLRGTIGEPFAGVGTGARAGAADDDMPF